MPNTHSRAEVGARQLVLKRGVTKTCKWMCTAALFVTVTVEAQMPIDRWMDKQNVLRLSNGAWATKGNEVLRQATTWVSLEHIMLSERSQSQKATGHMAALHAVVGKKNPCSRKQCGGYSGLEMATGLTANGRQDLTEWWNHPQIGLWWQLFNSANVLKIITSHTYNRWI